MDLCGGFVVVDNSGNVALIHQTAREYLLNGDKNPFRVVRATAHKQLVLSCLQCLMTVGLRSKIKGNQRPEFLDYAARSWSSHLTLTPPSCEETMEALNRFLTSHWILTWIQLLAADNLLGTLVQSSQNLSKYCVKKGDYHASDPDNVQLVQQERMRSWAEDFVRLVGKFGAVLRRNPESIYRQVPPFCPQNSAIYQQFGKTKDKSLVVSGLSTENWDDSLARLSFASGTYASSILSAGARVAILIPLGTVHLHDSSTFEEVSASPIKHGERVYKMALNSAGTLVTYGYLQTKVWDIPGGKCRLSIKNVNSRPRPFAMLLANNSTRLLVGCDDRRIRSLSLEHTSPSWQTVQNSKNQSLKGTF